MNNGGIFWCKHHNFRCHEIVCFHRAIFKSQDHCSMKCQQFKTIFEDDKLKEKIKKYRWEYRNKVFKRDGAEIRVLVTEPKKLKIKLKKLGGFKKLKERRDFKKLTVRGELKKLPLKYKIL